ncbi:MAG: zinc-binding dehydrogenase [Anaerolineales bacterium]
MEAAVYKGIEEIEIKQIERPEPGPGEALMKIGAGGVCGTDLRIFANGHHRIPPGTRRILGHELAGEIIAVGERVSSLTLGDRVGVAPNIGCGVCTQCVAGWTNLCEDYQAFGISLDGAFADYMLISREAIQQGNVVKIPKDFPFTQAALAEPLSCCLNGQEAVQVTTGDVVLVVGAGPIGMMHARLAKLRGASTVIVSEFSESRLRAAEELGADVAVNPNEASLDEIVRRHSDSEGADVIIVAAPAPSAQEESLELAARQGRINFFGGLPKDRPHIEFNSNLVHYKQLIVTGTTGSNVRQYRTSMDLLVHGRIDLAPFVSATLPLTAIHEAFERAQAGEEMRILLEPSG